MRFFINDRYYLSVITQLPEFESSPETTVRDSSDDNALALQENTPKYSCQVMELVNGFGMIPTTITENQKDVVGCIVHSSAYFAQTSRIVDTLVEVSEFHTSLVKEWYSVQI